MRCILYPQIQCRRELPGQIRLPCPPAKRESEGLLGMHALPATLTFLDSGCISSLQTMQLAKVTASHPARPFPGPTVGVTEPTVRKTMNKEQAICKCSHGTSVGGDLCSIGNGFAVRATPGLSDCKGNWDEKGRKTIGGYMVMGKK